MHETIAGAAAALLGYGYTTESLFQAQIIKRLAAAYSALNIDQPAWDDYKGTIKTAGGDLKVHSGEVFALIGRVIAVAQDGSQDVTLKSSQLGSVHEVPILQALPSILRELRNQMALVYQNNQSTTVRWALDAADAVRMAGLDQTPALTAELLHLSQIKELVENRPYVGLCAKMPESLTQANYPLLAYIGVMYHQMHLVTEDQKQSFRGFNVDGVGKRVAEPRLQDMCLTVARQLPKPSHTTLAAIISHMSSEDAEALISQYGAEDQRSLKKAVVSNHPTCSWAVNETAKVKAEARAKVLAQLSARLEQRWSEALNQARERMWASPDLPTKQAAQQKLDEISRAFQEIRTAVDGGVDDLLKTCHS